MSYSEQVLSRATERLEARRKKQQSQRNEFRRMIYTEIPRIAWIDKRLQQAVPKVVSLAFRAGEDPKEAVERLRRENLGLQEERARLLKEHHYRPDALDDTPLCPMCNDSGWRGAQMCLCLKELCLEEQTKELSALFGMGDQRFEKFRLEYYDEVLWPEWGTSPRKNMENILTFCTAYAKQFGRNPTNNLFFYGRPGLGKTFLSACIARSVSEQGFSVVYDTAGSIFARFEEQKFSRDQEDVREAKDVTRKYLRCDLLIMVDLGSEFTSPMVQTSLYTLVNTRLVEGRCTIISSNYNMDELRGRYSAQILSRLEGEYEPLPFFGKDIRQMERY